jgi:mevalonate kinase
MKPETYKSNGKLLLTGEYVVLDGGLSLAIPTKFGQSLEITSIKEPKIKWKSFDYKNHVWFEDKFTLQEITSGFTSHRNDTSKRLLQILQAVKQLNPGFLKNLLGFEVTSKLNFPQDWGLGSSSTLINNIANWAKIDAYKLLELTFGGSGYDIACAQHDTAITYQLSSNNQRSIKEVDFNPSFKEALYFVYLNKKQNSRDGIAQYKANTTDKTQVIKEINEITSKVVSCSNLTDFNLLLNNHEQLISSIIHQVPVKEKLFSDFNGSIKSLGAWGGDFVMVTSEENPKEYFSSKGYDTLIPYSEMIK